MIFILGKNFNSDLKVINMLKHFYGIGHYMSEVILNDLNITKNCRVKDLNQNALVRIPKWIEKFKVDIEDTLKQKIALDIKRLKLNKSYRGYRHIYNLPVRGQKTRSNSITNKKLSSHANKIKKFT
uniref:Ribosomal protein S13 n=1 Tax=Guillardia theta TaxID=55529 RepID=A0A481WB09_GUITH|nr:ribosomal protein S13 [Guillardia theta]QBJ06312.1 ribosomal protein S13 [Guillardia theta]